MTCVKCGCVIDEKYEIIHKEYHALIWAMSVPAAQASYTTSLILKRYREAVDDGGY